MPALIAMLAIMTLALLLAMPTWNFVVKEDKEQELIFRGRQISAAIARFQRKNGNALPASLEQLVKGKFLRKEYKDPMTADGKWRILLPGQAGPARPGPGGPGSPGGPGRTPPGRTPPAPSPTPAPTPIFGGNSGGPAGPIAGVASRSTESGLRTINGTQNYSQWIFAPSVPLVFGGQPPVGGPPGQNQVPSQKGLRAPDVEMPRISR
jgi:type II secretory pathway pseudopilin PulG